LRRTELHRQLESISERRDQLAEQLHDAQGPQSAQALDARIKALDDRSAALDQQLNALDDAVSASLGSGITIGRTQIPGVTIVNPRGFGGGDPIAKVMAVQGIGFVFLGVMVWRLLRRRVASAAVRLAPEDSNRVEQLQRAVDVIALEVERISEGQRYVAKLLTERPVIGAGASSDIATRKREGQAA